MKKNALFFVFLVYITGIIYSCETTDEDMLFQKKSAILIKHTADDYNPPSMNIGDPEKYYWPKAMARFEKYGLNDSIANSYIESLKNNSPFHFTLVGMARIICKYKDAPAMKDARLTIIRKVFERDDSYNPWTAEGTENHTNMTRTSAYIYAQEALKHAELFPSADEKLKEMKNWIIDWSRKIYQNGTGEWNSGIYYTYNVIGWLNLFDFALDEEVKLAARAVLDYYAAEMALHYSWGTTGGPEMRGSGAQNVNNNATNYLCWLWFSEEIKELPFTFRGSQYIQSIHAITSQYRPDEAILKLARKEIEKPAWFRESKPEYLFMEPSFVKQFFYVGDQYSLGSCVSPYGGWTGTTAQMVNWRLIVKADEEPIPYEIGGNGRFYDEWSGKICNPFTQVFQHKNVLIQLTKTPENAEEIAKEIIKIVKEWQQKWKKDFQKRFPTEQYKGKRHNVVNYIGNMVFENRNYLTLPEDIQWEVNDGVCFIELGDVIISIHTIGLPGSPEPVAIEGKKTKDRLFLIDEAKKDKLCGIVLEVIDRDNDLLFKDQQEWILNNTMLDKSEIESDKITYKSSRGDEIEMQYNNTGRFMEATVDWGYGASEPMVMLSAPPFKQPDWPEGKGFGRIPSCKVNGQPVDFTEPWPVFEGKTMKLDEGVLEIRVENKFYRVNYRDYKPVFPE